MAIVAKSNLKSNIARAELSHPKPQLVGHPDKGTDRRVVHVLKHNKLSIALCIDFDVNGVKLSFPEFEEDFPAMKIDLAGPPGKENIALEHPHNLLHEGDDATGTWLELVNLYEPLGPEEAFVIWTKGAKYPGGPGEDDQVYTTREAAEARAKAAEGEFTVRDYRYHP